MLSRLQQLRMRGSRRTTAPQSVAAPLKGWNTRDPFEAMDPQDAILLDNWYPSYAGLTVRNGSLTYARGLGNAPVQTLAEFRSSAISQLLAACAGTIYDITDAANILSVQGGFATDVWDVVTFQGHQFWANGNGTDSVQTYDGTTMANAGFTGVDLTTLSGAGVFNNRLYFWTGTDPAFWYGGVNSITGSLTKFALDSVERSGGNLIAVQPLTYDGGNGISDYTCFFMSTGEVLTYSGTDPSNPNNWALVGRYVLPMPIAKRAITRYGGDIYVTTANDHQQLSKLLIALKLGDVPPLTKMTGAVVAAVAGYRNAPGWQSLYYGAGQRLIHNIPGPGNTFAQHILNTSTQAWCRFTGLNAYCFGLFNDTLYYGGAQGQVLLADTGSTDDGVPILAQSQQAWQLMGTPLKKRIAALHPVVQAPGIINFIVSLGFDYQPSVIQVPDATIVTAGSMIWGTTNWGAGNWGGAGVTDPNWHIAGGEGGAIGIGLSVNSMVGATWIRTDLMIEPGTAL